MATNQLLANLPPAKREAARPVIEAHVDAMREMAAKLAPLVAQARAVIAEMAQ